MKIFSFGPLNRKGPRGQLRRSYMNKMSVQRFLGTAQEAIVLDRNMQLIDQTPTQKLCFKNRSFIVILCPKILFRPQIVVLTVITTQKLTLYTEAKLRFECSKKIRTKKWFVNKFIEKQEVRTISYSTLYTQHPEFRSLDSNFTNCSKMPDVTRELAALKIKLLAQFQ